MTQTRTLTRQEILDRLAYKTYIMMPDWDQSIVEKLLKEGLIRQATREDIMGPGYSYPCNEQYSYCKGPNFGKVKV